jgi:hypothetical protein
VVSGIDFFELARPDLRPGTYTDSNSINVVVVASA